MKKNMKRLIIVVIAMGMAAIMVWPVLAVTQQNIQLEVFIEAEIV